MLEAEIQKLEAQIQRLNGTVEALVTATMELRSSLHLVAGDLKGAFVHTIGSVAAAPAPTTAPESVPSVKVVPLNVETAQEQKPRVEKKTRAEKKVEVAPESAAEGPADPKPSISKDNLKDLALQISKADTDSKVEIFAILSAHGAKTITALPDDDDTLFDVFTRLTNLAARVAKEAE